MVSLKKSCPSILYLRNTSFFCWSGTEYWFHVINHIHQPAWLSHVYLHFVVRHSVPSWLSKKRLSCSWRKFHQSLIVLFNFILVLFPVPVLLWSTKFLANQIHFQQEQERKFPEQQICWSYCSVPPKKKFSKKIFFCTFFFWIMEVSNPSISCFIIKNPVDQWNRTEIGIIILNFVPKNNNFDWSDFACRSFQEQNRNRTGIKLNRTNKLLSQLNRLSHEL